MLWGIPMAFSSFSTKIIYFFSFNLLKNQTRSVSYFTTSNNKYMDFQINILKNKIKKNSYRFHLLSEFDNGKRSCRKRLADHNRRRRKCHQSASITHDSGKSTLDTTTSPTPSTYRELINDEYPIFIYHLFN